MIRALELLRERAAAILGRSLSPNESSAFAKYLELLLKWQKIHRLVGSSEPEWIAENLFLDSLLFLRVLPQDVASLVDVGSGAGFPGIPIKIVRPNLHVHLVFVGRAEGAPSSMLRAFEAAVARCAGDPAALRPIASRLVRSGGLMVFSGPPVSKRVTGDEWVEVEGILAGSVRRFSVSAAD
jgi:hypothetical protein